MAVAQKPNAIAGEKKPKSTPSHPPYLVMIREAIVALKERSGSSQYAIAKHIEANHSSHIPQNFKKHLLIQLKKLVANGKLVKVKNSFKLAPLLKSSKPTVEKKPRASAVDTKKAKVVVEKPNEKAVAKKAKKGPIVKISEFVPPGKRNVVKKKMMMAAAAAKKPKTKSIKSPAKKAVARKSNK